MIGDGHDRCQAVKPCHYRLLASAEVFVVNTQGEDELVKYHCHYFPSCITRALWASTWMISNKSHKSCTPSTASSSAVEALPAEITVAMVCGTLV